PAPSCERSRAAGEDRLRLRRLFAGIVDRALGLLDRLVERGECRLVVGPALPGDRPNRLDHPEQLAARAAELVLDRGLGLVVAGAAQPLELIQRGLEILVA